MTRICSVLLALLLSVPAVAQEVVTLTTPIARPSQTTIRIERIILDVVALSIHIQWVGNNGEAGSAVYSTPAVLNNCGKGQLQPTGATLLTALNTANLSTTSLVKNVMIRLQTDCWIPAGAISGTAQ